MRKVLLAAALVLMATSAQAKTYEQCVAEVASGLATPEDAKRLCKPGVLVKPPKLGWHCNYDSERNKSYTFKAPGGTRLKRDVVCGEE